MNTTTKPGIPKTKSKSEYQTPDYDALQKRLDQGIAQHHKSYAAALTNMDKDRGKYAKEVAKLTTECDTLRDAIDKASEAGKLNAAARKAGRLYLKKQMRLYQLYAADTLAMTRGTPLGHTPANVGDKIEDEADGDD